MTLCGCQESTLILILLYCFLERKCVLTLLAHLYQFALLICRIVSRLYYGWVACMNCVYLYARTITLVCVSLFIGSEKLPDLEEMDGGDKEMTEEEWSRRVAELNKHQVTITKAHYIDFSLHVT